jgi:calcium-dependent protein kinase
MGSCQSKEKEHKKQQPIQQPSHALDDRTATTKDASVPESARSTSYRHEDDDQMSTGSSHSSASAKRRGNGDLDSSQHRRMDSSNRGGGRVLDASLHRRLDASNHKNGMRRANSNGDDPMMIDGGGLTSNIVHMEVPFGKPIEDVYDGIHDGPILGSGISGVVRVCIHKKTQVKYAVKCLDLGLLETDDALEQLREEIFIMCQLDHPNIVRLEEVYESHNEIYLVMELCQGGELFDRLDEQPDYHYTEQECARLVKQMLNSLRYIHSKGIIHRDLKLENFLFSGEEDDAQLKMIDFGLSKHFEMGEVQHEAVGTPYTVAPEVIRGGYDERCDVWAIGVITYLLLSGDPPFGGCGGPESLAQVRRNILKGSFVFEPEDIWENVSDVAKGFIKSLLKTNPKNRPTARQAQHSRWLQEWAVKEHKEDSKVLNPNVVKALVGFKEYGDMRKLLCEVLSFTLLPDQIQDLRKEFEKLDKDGSGEISLDGLKSVLLAEAGAGSLGALTEKEVEDIFNAMRVRKDETTIHWHEFIAAGLSQCKVDDRNLRLAFDRLDGDHKGYITLDDIIILMGSDSSMSEEKMRAIYVEGLREVGCDTSKICYDDFLKLMKGQSREIESARTPEPKLKKPNTLEHISEASIIEEDPAEDDEKDDAQDIDEERERAEWLKSRYSRQRSQSEGVIDLAPKPLHTDNNDLSTMHPMAIPEHGEAEEKHDRTKPLSANRNLYRAHRQMRLAVMDATKRFEEEQMKHVFKEEVKKSRASLGAGLVMKHGESKKLSTDEVRKILKKRQQEQQELLQKANKRTGRGPGRKKTASDLTMLFASSDSFGNSSKKVNRKTTGTTKINAPIQEIPEDSPSSFHKSV